MCGRRRARSRSLCVAYTLDECRVVFFTRFFSSFWFVSLFFSTPRNPHLHLPHPSIYSTIIIAATKTFIHSHNRTISYSYLLLPLRVTNEPTNPRSVPILYLLFLSWPLVITIIYWVVRITAVHLFFLSETCYLIPFMVDSHNRRCIYRLFYIFNSNLFCVDTSAPQKRPLININKLVSMILHRQSPSANEGDSEEDQMALITDD